MAGWAVGMKGVVEALVALWSGGRVLEVACLVGAVQVRATWLDAGFCGKLLADVIPDADEYISDAVPHRLLRPAQSGVS